MMKLIVISFPDFYNNEHYIIQKLFENDLEYFHLRKPDWSYHELDTFIKKTGNEFHNRIIIHSHYRLAEKYSLKGIHLTEKYRNLHKLDLKYNIDNLQLSTSFHKLSGLYRYKPQYHYVFISPVFDSISKKDYKSAFKEKNISQALNRTKYDVIALGGITINHLVKVKQLGFSGLAVLGAIWNSPNPVDEFIKIKKELRKQGSR